MATTTITPAVSSTPKSFVDTTDYQKLYQDKRNEYVAKYAGKPGMNPYLFLHRFAAIEKCIFLSKQPLDEAQKTLIKSTWPEPKV